MHFRILTILLLTAAAVSAQAGEPDEIGSETLGSRTAASLSHLLQGTVPGLDIKINSGSPSDDPLISIRGLSSVTGSTPLVLVDGAQVSLSSVNPKDVETVAVLKDAAATAIYGTLGANGVILVTTRKGNAKGQRAQIEYSGSVGFSRPTTRTDYESRGYDSAHINDIFYHTVGGSIYSNYTDADMAELLARRGDRKENPSRPWTIIDQRASKDTYIYYANTDWYHYLYRDTAPMTQHNATLSGGASGITYYVSGGFKQTDGVIRHDTDKDRRYDFRVRLSFDLTPWAVFSTNTDYHSSTYTFPGGMTNVNEIFKNSTFHALASYPTTNPDGTSLVTTVCSYDSIMNGILPSLQSGKDSNKQTSDRLTTINSIDIKPLEGLTAGASFAYSLTGEANTYRRANAEYSQYPGEIAYLTAGMYEDKLIEERSRSRSYSIDLKASYEKVIARKHSLKVLAGYNWKKDTLGEISATGYNLMGDKPSDLDLTGSDANGNRRTDVGGGKYAYAVQGIYARINYCYDERYAIEVSGREDGTSKFGSGKRWGSFPGVSASWHLSNEHFFEKAKRRFSDLQVHYSYGSAGNADLGYYDYLRRVVIREQDYLLGGSTKPTSASVTAPAASDLTWGRTEQHELGLSAATLRDRLSLDLDGYVKLTKDMLTADIFLPGTYGAAAPKVNSADMRTLGWELSLRWKDSFKLWGRNFGYGAKFILSDSISEITRFDNPTHSLSNHYAGERVGELWGYKTQGLFASDEAASSWGIDQSGVNSRILASHADEGKLRAGDLIFSDLDGDGKVTSGAYTASDHGDLRKLGNTQPRYHYGLTLDAKFQGFDFSIFFQGIGHIDWYPGDTAYNFWGPFINPGLSFIPKDFQSKYWSEDNPNSYYPRPRGRVVNGRCTELGAVNDRFLQNIGYCRLKNLTFGYSFPAEWLSKAGISKLRAYFSGENLACWSGIKSGYIDPEQAAHNDMRLYPWQKTFTFGIDLTF